MGWERWEVRPDTIILDTESDWVDFCNKVVDLEMHGIFTKEELISGLISYIQDERTAQENVSEYAWDLALIFSSYPEKDLHDFVYALKELGAHLIDQLKFLVAYDDAGALWYEFAEFCGEDIVLKRSTLNRPLPRNSK